MFHKTADNPKSSEADHTGQIQFKFFLVQHMAIFVDILLFFSLISALLILVSLATTMFHIPGSTKKKKKIVDRALLKTELIQS